MRSVCVLLVSVLTANAQVCRISAAGLNQQRKVTGAIHAECPDNPVHSAPFGNWGVTSNFGQKGDSHQFDGWCHDMRVCDNSGTCFNVCMDGWYEWNSCTDHPRFTAPNCSLYNSASCTEQTTTTGINVHGTRYVDIPVSCPRDTNGDGIPDQGGCAEVQSYSTGTNFISLYELDPVCCDELVQTVYFPALTIPLQCDVYGCAAAASPWVSPSAWDSPPTPAKVYAQMSTVVNWGGFVDANNTCRLAAPTFRSVSAASFSGPNLAPNSIATALGDNLAPATGQAISTPLPQSLAGVTVTVTDRFNQPRQASLSYASPGQINYIVPAATATGAATVNVYSGTVLRSTSRAQIEAVAPAIFTANADGKGVPAALIYQGASVTPAFQCGSAPGGCITNSIAFTGEPTYLVLFGTGIRNRSALTAVGATIGETHLRVDYAGPQNQYEGLDQINVLLPPDLSGRGLVDLQITVDSRPANTVQLTFR